MILDTIKSWFGGDTASTNVPTVTVVAGQTVCANAEYVVCKGGTYRVDELVPCRHANASDSATASIATCQFLACDVVGVSNTTEAEQ